MSNNQTSYHSFLIRIWRDDDQIPWRVQLEDPSNGERHGFASIAKMVQFLEQQMGKPITEKEQ